MASRKARNSGRSGGAAGNGCTRSRRKLPRKSSFKKLGAVHSVSRASSATCRASASLTCLREGSLMLTIKTLQHRGTFRPAVA